MRCSPVPHLRLHLPVNLAPRPSPLRPAPPPPSSPIRFSPRPFPRRRRGLLAPRPSGHGRSAAGSPSPGSPEDDFDVELGRLLALLPEEMRRRVGEHPERSQLIEVVMDLGRKPLARFPSGDFVLSELPVTHEDLERATSQVGDFAVDNRAGISRTLHRISGIRNRKGTIIGLTCRVGRAISGSAPLLRDLVQTGDSLLLIGPPGVGKTTIIREIARMLANDYGKRVMIVDTSNEIGGDGDIPHEGIGNARRMQVPNSDMQHKVLIEAVENHMPQVIVIDEIGTKLEAMAASTIAQRGIQLVATAHGVTIENLIMNPALEMLVGGIQSVTLGDEEASRRGVQKTVLERKGPSTFSCGVEIVSKTELRVHRSLEATVDAVLSGRLPKFEVRKMGTKDSRGNAETEPFAYSSLSDNDDTGFIHVPDRAGETAGYSDYAPELPPNRESFREDGARLSLYNYGIPEASIVQVIKQLNLGEDVIQLTDNISQAHALLALQSKLKKNPGIQAAARSHGIPIYVTKTSSLVQITNAVRALLRDRDGSEDTEVEDKSKLLEKTDALEEARVAIEQVVIPKGEPVELLPRSSSIMSLQLDLIRKYQLQSERVGKEPDILLRILPYDSGSYEDGDSTDNEVVDGFDDFGSTNGSTYNISKLPLLPD
ncbi:protein SEEDLING PLASTID DEVELOPMENT 1 isoform X1 [Syzygium oleosum]|uniref:protein SEEDLING PLASTID DEVELOPMENT 1 isoform X1 n=1 Tax=Syzygium oleosum TaxID=219896 RepID=UPI0011D1BF7F|nr:protein SEEDLING PLASTID DEVELOPMENT 1 isoform X1 [Syzygium oleosum]XP_030443540.1 protein SEEDLING PLASTID DEVELOPMENT 1 isoform X1 [Syzygium oleosum]XP_056167797.1 protein SEEDLING PLASTID DEVELOPMENT 1 isoform X1 [Syzygium oleosum]XP_056167798.1 protein SEEDLING PLASTID DEVELOPMENT 1 isoform X1 [Syzygium oleosum]